MTDEKTCYNCGNKNCNVYYSTIKKDSKRHSETYEYNDFDCVNHDKWEELKVEEIRTDNTETLKNALERIEELEQEKCELLRLIQGKDKVIKDLEKENAERKDDNKVMANEWHFPSKGELPECDETTQLIFYVTCFYNPGITLTRMVLGFYQKSFINDDVKLFVEKSKGYSDEHFPKYVIAWKEIVPPKMED